MAIVALDVGERRIGVAISDPGESFALPLETIERTTLHDDLERIVTLAREHSAAVIVVGDPIALSGERAIAAVAMDRFAEKLRGAFEGTVERVDERLTTALVEKQLIAAGAKRRERRRVVDQLAAASILETYLARRARRPGS